MYVSEIMQRDIVTVTPTTTIREIVHKSCYKNIHMFPVMYEDKVVGIVGRRDILNAGFNMI